MFFVEIRTVLWCLSFFFFAQFSVFLLLPCPSLALSLYLARVIAGGDFFGCTRRVLLIICFPFVLLCFPPSGHRALLERVAVIWFSFCLDALYLAAVGRSPPGCKSLNTWEAHTTLFKQESASSSSEWEERDRVFWEASRFFSLRSSSRGCL